MGKDNCKKNVWAVTLQDTVKQKGGHEELEEDKRNDIMFRNGEGIKEGI